MLNKISRDIYITGSTGFVGSRVANKLIDSGFSVKLLTRNIKKIKNLFPNFSNENILHYDISLNSKNITFKSSDILIHCAWSDLDDIMSVKHIEDHLFNHYSFLKKSIQSGLGKLIVTGSFSEYGMQYGPVYPSTITSPNTSYGLAKDTLHKLIKQLKTSNSFEFVWLRLFYVYAEQGNLRGLFASLEQTVKEGFKDFSMSTGDQLVDYSDVENVAEKVIDSILWNSGVYNVCSGNPLPLKTIVQKWLDLNSYSINLNCGVIPKRDFESIAIWGGLPKA
jgi:dTDP-6-deoxy-L-talose 4-dehydrogenase (NAD+)